MTYEYQNLQIPRSQLTATMNERGLLGWEAFFVSPSLVTEEWCVMVYFKRPVPAPAVTP